jgi:xylan 1,4-beta-xylosidase
MARKWSRWCFVAAMLLMLTDVTAAQLPQPIVASTYRNPINLGNMGDPYVLRWNGRYYLYPTTGGQGLRSWVSEDLIHWQSLGYVAQEPVARGAYAPEVIYWNGTFYMYLSRPNDGHYVLTSESPTGPFTQQTQSLGWSIDGSVFIDHDGRWYFTHAAGRGIRGHQMSDPYTIGPEVRLDSDLGGWTEGPGIFYRQGFYFMTYCGNHYLSKGYRIHYSVSDTGPLGPWQMAANNPIVLNTSDDFSGLGHNSNVIGPDLDSYYMAYHNRQVEFGSSIRLLNIDRLVFNGKKLSVLGAANRSQPVPKMADFYTWIDEDGYDDRWQELVIDGLQLLVGRPETAADYTAEFNFHIQERPTQPHAFIGAVFSYVDAANFIYVIVDLTEHQLIAVAVREGRHEPLGDAPLPREFDFTKLHTIRVEKDGHQARIYCDGMLKLQLALGQVEGGKIGYVYKQVEPVFRFTAFSNDVSGSSDYNVYKPIPGEIEAVHYLRDDGHFAQGGRADNPLRRGDATRIRIIDDRYVLQLAAGEWTRYNINVKETGLYGVAMVLPAGQAAAQAAVYVDNADPQPLQVPGTSSGPGAMKVHVGTIHLPAGFHTLTLRLDEGTVALYNLEFYSVASDPPFLTAALTDGLLDVWSYYGAPGWQADASGYRLSGIGNGMVILGESSWTDYSVEIDVKLESAMSAGTAGLLLRVQNPSYYDAQVVDSLQGYYVALNGQTLVLRRLNYDSQTLQEVNLPVAPGQYGRLRVEVTAGQIRAYWQGMEQPLLEYVDPQAFMSGAVGFRTDRSDAVFKNLTVQCASCSVYGQMQVADQRVWILPQIAQYHLTLPFGTYTDLPITFPSLSGDAPVHLLDPQARFLVTPPDTLPGVAYVQVLDKSNTVVHTVALHLQIDTIPQIAAVLENAEQSGALLRVGGDALFRFAGAEAGLLRSSCLQLEGLVDGEPIPTVPLYQGVALPETWLLDTLQFADGSYELVAQVETIYGTTAQSSVKFIVKNWEELVDDLQPPISSMFFGAVSRDKTIRRSSGWQYVGDDPQVFAADYERLATSTKQEEYLIWEVPELRRFTAVVFSQDETIDDVLAVEISADLEHWTALNLIDQQQGAVEGWYKHQLSATAPADDEVQYVRLRVLEQDDQEHTIQVGQVRLLMQVK